MKFLSTFVFFLSSAAAFAQPVTVGSTEEYTNIIPEASWKQFLGYDATGYYILRESGPISNQKIWLEKYSPAMKLISTTNIESTSGTMGNSLLHRYTRWDHGKVYVFLEGWNKVESQNSFHVKVMNDDGSMPETATLLETEFSTGQLKSADYSVSFSPDGSKMLVLTEKPFKKGEKEELRLQVFSTKDYTSLWKKELTLENESVRYPDNDIAVDNSGIVYLYKDIKISGKEHTYQLVTHGGDFTKTEKIDLQTYFPTHYKMQIDSTGKLVIAGTLATQGENASEWRATWYLQADASGAIVQNKVEQLGTELLRLIVSEKAAATDNYSLDNYVFKDVVLKPNGGLILLAEYQADSYTVIGTAQPPVYQYDLRYGNVVAISLDENGNRVWANVLVKGQQELTLNKDKHYGSFAYQLKNDQLYLVWNFTDLHVDFPVHSFRYWFDRSGAKINIDNIFGKEAYYPTMLSVINPDGTFQYADRSYNALPLEDIQKPNAFPMAVDPSFFFPTPEGMVILARMPGKDSKRFKFNTIKY